MSAPAPRVLVAVSQSGYAIARKMLAGCDADIVTSFEQGTQALARQAYGYVLVGVLFAESHMFEFVQEVKQSQPGARVLGVRGLGTPLSEEIRSGLQAALQTVGADGLIDLTRGQLSAWEQAALLEMRRRCWPQCDASKIF
ncbi:MAG TPA: hypothetical protein VGQ93_10600 [Lysobacter sp.]|jgi:hypothetical protein|nr:hypothetical protein [Lysobacter sp.]